MAEPLARGAGDGASAVAAGADGETSNETGHGRERATAGAVQLAFPPMQRLLREDDGRFSHPAERDFARLLSQHRVRWAYEPTTFAIEWAADGRPCGFFTPDFYLPDHQTYVELTTMRQPLVTRKNRKLRLLRQTYPEIRVKLLYKRDLQRLAAVADPPTEAPADRVGEVLYSGAEIGARLARLAEQVADEWLGHESTAPAPVVLAVGRGSRRSAEAFAAELRRYGLVLPVEQVDIARFKGKGDPTRFSRRHRGSPRFHGRSVLIVEEIVSTGLSLGSVVAWLRRQGAVESRVLALLDRGEARLIERSLDWVAFPAPADLLVGFGFSLRRQFSDLGHIACLDCGRRPGVE